MGTASSFNTLISAHARNKATAAADEVFSCMLQARVTPTIVSYNALASAHAACADLPAVERVMAKAVDQLGSSALDRFSYGALLLACVKAKAPAGVSRKHVQALQDSKVTMNDYLRSLCSRAVGERELVTMLAKHDKERA